jgi:hypothetical protein
MEGSTEHEGERSSDMNDDIRLRLSTRKNMRSPKERRNNHLLLILSFNFTKHFRED